MNTIDGGFFVAALALVVFFAILYKIFGAIEDILNELRRLNAMIIHIPGLRASIASEDMDRRQRENLPTP